MIFKKTEGRRGSVARKGKGDAALLSQSLGKWRSVLWGGAVIYSRTKKRLIIKVKEKCISKNRASPGGGEKTKNSGITATTGI